VTAFSLSAAYAAIGGGLYACLVSFIVGPSFALELSLLFVLMVMLGGAGSVYGPIIGAAFVVAIPEVASNVDWGLDVVYGLTIVVIVLLAPRGLAGLTEQMTRAVRARTG